MKAYDINQIVESYINGQKKQMTDQIRTYGASQFFIDLAPYLDEYCPNTPELYQAICIAYHHNVKTGMLIT